ncbi:MAG: pyruvate kinase [Tenericutes bacterium]|nr:pyruvate kinase [Mycoplasmatota bacterium]
MKKTKIVCSIGPVSESIEMLESLTQVGMDVARINFSHATVKERKTIVDNIRKVRKSTGANIAIMWDTKGPEFRTGTFKNGFVQLKDGHTVRIVKDNVVGNEERFSVNHPEALDNIEIGSTVFLENALMRLEVIDKSDIDITCRIIAGGILGDNKSISVPGVKLNIPYISKEDKKDIEWACDNGGEFIAMSFVSCADDVLEVRKLLKKYDREDMQIISKIENGLGVTNIEEILDVSDGVMIARGDLGCEVANEQLPIIQKTIIKACREMGKIAIVATEMLESMMSSIRPKRAETSDIANAVIDGVDAVMLSGETTIGKYPVEAVRTMADICETTEEYVTFDYIDDNAKVGAISNAISENLVESANRLDAKLICVTTLTGRTAKQISNLKPQALILALCPDEDTCHSLALNWGVYTDILPKCKNTDEVLKNSLDKCKKFMKLKKRDVILISGNSPYYGADKSTNFIKIQEM